MRSKVQQKRSAVLLTTNKLPRAFTQLPCCPLQHCRDDNHDILHKPNHVRWVWHLSHLLSTGRYPTDTLHVKSGMLQH